MGRSGNPVKRAAQERARSQGSGHRPATFYCDESGNTGVNWGDPDQPVFVHGGWLIPQESHDALVAELTSIKAQRHLNAPELKWTQVSRRSNGAAVFKDIFKVMLTHGAVPFFQAMDKDYLLAAKAVETFFDPAYNDALPMAFASNFEAKKNLAEQLTPVPSLLTDFGEMLRAGTDPGASRIERLALQMADVVGQGDSIGLADTLRHLKPDGLAAIGSELNTDVWMRTTLGHSMFALMNRLENFLCPRNTRIEIVHDNIVRFDELLSIVQGMFRESDGTDFIVINGDIRFFSMPTVDGMRLGDSKVETGIQLADLLCGFVRTIFTKLKQSRGLDADELAVCGDLVMLEQEFYSWEVNLPKATLERFISLGWSDIKERFAQ